MGCVYVLCRTGEGGERRIVLRPNEVNIEDFVKTVCCKSVSDSYQQSKELGAQELAEVTSAMDTEWDRKCLKAVLGHNLSRKKLQDLGLDPQKARTSMKQVKENIVEMQNTAAAAEDMLKIRLEAKAQRLEKELAEKNQLLVKKRNVWPSHEIAALERNISILELRISENKEIINHETSASQKKFNNMNHRLASSLIERNRTNRRSLGSGRKALINDECEDYIAKCIEEKASSHGRRNDTILYTGRRVKKADLLSIANYKLREQSKSEIRSCTTVWNRSNPRNKRSIQAKNHQGRGLFCTRKPYKGEDQDNENTHYQRAFVNNVKRYFFSEKMVELRPFCLMRSIDDKAYLRPGTSEGFRSVRNGRILMPSSDEKMKKLPKYDWPIKAVYITPSTHRFIHRKGSTIDDKEVVISEGDRHTVFVRPKFYVDSS